MSSGVELVEEAKYVKNMLIVMTRNGLLYKSDIMILRERFTKASENNFQKKPFDILKDYLIEMDCKVL